MTRHSAVCVWIPLVASCARPRRIYGFAAIHGVVGAWRYARGASEDADSGEHTMTSIIMSIICAPPMIVRISDACPGQSTSVNCTLSSDSPARKDRRWRSLPALPASIGSAHRRPRGYVRARL
jgi:hypothetical protein